MCRRFKSSRSDQFFYLWRKMDYRTKRQKLQAMANQTASPHEAEIAKRLLAEMGPEPTPIYNGTMIFDFARTVSFTVTNVKFYWGPVTPSGSPFGFGTGTYTFGTSPKKE